MSLLPEEEYVDSSYFAVTDYVGGIADAVVVFGGYFVEGSDYFATDYILDQAVVATMSADLTLAIVFGDAILVGSTTMSTTTSRTRVADVTLNNIINLSAQSDRLRDSGSNLISTTTSTTTAALTKPGAADFVCVSNITAITGNIKQGGATLDASGSILTAAGVVGDFFVNCPTVATIDVGAEKITDTSVATNSTATFTVVGNKIANSGSATLNSTSEISTVAARIRDVDSSVGSAFGSNITGNRIRAGGADFNDGGLGQDPAQTTTLTATANKIATGISSVPSEFAIVATGRKVLIGAGDFNTLSSINCNATKLVQFASNMQANINSSATATITASGNSTLNTVSTGVFRGGVQYIGSADFVALSAIISINKIVHPSRMVYIIPKETRSYLIPRETRTHSITAENRTYTIEGK